MSGTRTHIASSEYVVPILDPFDIGIEAAFTDKSAHDSLVYFTHSLLCDASRRVFIALEVDPVIRFTRRERLNLAMSAYCCERVCCATALPRRALATGFFRAFLCTLVEWVAWAE